MSSSRKSVQSEAGLWRTSHGAQSTRLRPGDRIIVAESAEATISVRFMDSEDRPIVTSLSGSPARAATLHLKWDWERREEIIGLICILSSCSYRIDTDGTMNRYVAYELMPPVSRLSPREVFKSPAIAPLLLFLQPEAINASALGQKLCLPRRVVLSRLRALEQHGPCGDREPQQ